MPNPVLVRLREDRARQFQFIDETLSRVDADGRDLVDAELSNLTAAREAVARLDAQIEPLEQFEALRDDHSTAIAPYRQPTSNAEAGRAAQVRSAVAQYGSPGAFIVDYIAARGLMSDGRGGKMPADPQAQGRIQYALQNQVTDDTPGLLPHTITGNVVNLIDASRPFITSVGGARSMAGIPGKTFGRPKITQHTLAGLQTAEKTELPSRKMIIGEVSFTKLTKGGAVDVSRQDIDWSSPAAWDILIRDLADSYAIDTENEAADAFVAGADDHAPNVGTVVGGATLEDWSAALYQAAGLIYASSKKLPDRLWISTDQWSAVGPLFDLACCSNGSVGSSSLTSFSGNMFNVDRIVVPSFPPGTVILGNSNAFEVYEEVIGLLTAVEPSLLGVEVAYGGYVAFGYVYAEGVAPITPPAPVAASSRSSRESSDRTADRKS